LQTIERPAPEGQAQALRVGQRRGDDLGALPGRISRRTPGPGPILQPVEALVIEAMNPGVDRRPGDAEVLGDLAGTSSVGEGQEDLSPLDESGLGKVFFATGHSVPGKIKKFNGKTLQEIDTVFSDPTYTRGLFVAGSR
jgi:hypothetical protein